MQTGEPRGQGDKTPLVRIARWLQHKGVVPPIVPPIGPRAQFGEDTILLEIFRNRSTGFCAEVGAHDGVTGSTTLAFERIGWQCLLVEPNPDLTEHIQRNRSCTLATRAASAAEGSAVFYVADHAVMSTLDIGRRQRRVSGAGGRLRAIEVQTARLDTLLADAGFEHLDFLTIDVEGHELEVLKGFTLERFTPRVVIIEEEVPYRRSKVARHMCAHGYINFRRTGVNEWYALRSDEELINPARVRRFRRQRQMFRVRDALFRSLVGEHSPQLVTRLMHRLADRLGLRG